MKTKVFVYNAVTAGGADLQVTSDLITLSAPNGTDSVSWIPKSGVIKSEGRIPAVAGTLQVTTGTITAVSGATYRIKITATNKIYGTVQVFTYQVVSDASATTAEIAAAFAAQINADVNISVTAAETSGTLVLTGVAPFYTFAVENANPASTTISFVTGTPGVISQGQGAIIVNNQYIQGNGLATTVNTTYAYTTFIFTVNNVTLLDTSMTFEPVQVVVYVYESASNYASFAGLNGTLTRCVRSGVQTAGGNAAVANGVITLGAPDIFYGNSDINVGLFEGDIITIGGVDYPIINILSGTTAATNGIPNDASSATTTYKLLKRF